MNVRLTGTSAADGFPALFCRCPVCGRARQSGGKNLRSRASALIDSVLKIDLPPDTLHHVLTQNLDLGCLEAVLITHAHDDHFSPAELQYLGEYFVVPPRKRPFPIYGPPEVTEQLKARFDSTNVLLEPHTLAAWETVRVADYRVTPIVAQHDPDTTCFNYIIEDSEGVTLLYASDTGWYEPPTWDFLKSVRLDGMIIECGMGVVEDGYQGHLSVSRVIAMRQRLIDYGSFAPECPVVTTHFSHTGGLLHQEMETIFAPYNIQPGYDGLRFEMQRRV